MKRTEPESWEKRLSALPVEKGGFSPELMNRIKERIAVEKPAKRHRQPVYWGAALVCSLLAVAVTGQFETIRHAWSGLSFKQSPVLEQMDKDKETTLKVAYFHTNTFMSNYGNAFVIRYPNVEVSVTESPNNAQYMNDKNEALAFMEKNNPDVMALSPAVYAELAKEGKLYPLESVIKQDRFDIDSIFGGVVQTLRELGGGKLYGLSPQFETLALYYNKELFNRYGVGYPASGSTWEDVLRLAARFPADGTGDSRVYGLYVPYYPEPYALVDQIAKTKGRPLVDSSGTKLLVNTEFRLGIWRSVLDLYRKGVVYKPEPWPRTGSVPIADVYKRNPFLNGKAAMAVAPFSLRRDLSESQSRYGFPAVDWDVVHEPTDPARPNASTSFRLSEVYVVNASSPNVRAAWELVKFINSEESAKKMAGSFSPPLSSRMAQVNAKDGRSVQPFFELMPGESSGDPLVPQSFYEKYGTVASAEGESVLAGRKPLQEALYAIQNKAQEALNEALAGDGGKQLKEGK